MPDKNDNGSAPVTAIADRSKDQCSVGLLIQAYCNSVQEQPKVSLGGFANLASYESEINSGLAAAQGHASQYLNTIQPSIITNVTNISNYFDLHSAVATSLPPGSSKQDWIDVLAAIRDAANGYKADAYSIVQMLGTLNQGLTADAASFASTVTQLNIAVNGDNGVLDSLDAQINDLDSKIAGAITGTVLSGLAIVGGAVMILVGAIADPFTGGGSTPLIVGGAAVLIAGVGGEAASGAALGGLLSAKTDLLSREASLRAEVQLALGLKSGFSDLQDQVTTAVKAATAMQNAWEFLESDLGNFSADLSKGILAPDALRTLWLTTANSAVKPVSDDITTIKQQMTGVTLQVAPRGTSIGSFVTDVAARVAA